MLETLSSDYSSQNSNDSPINCLKFKFYQTRKNHNIKLKIESEEDNSISFSKLVSDLLTNICEQSNTNSDSLISSAHIFISKKIPSISVNNYIGRLLKYSKTFEKIIIIILIYLDTICTKHKINLNYFNIHKFIFAAFLVAIKFHEDEYYSISYYARLGGISVKEATNLEYEFMNLIDFKLFVSQDIYDKYYKYLCSIEEDI